MSEAIAILSAIEGDKKSISFPFNPETVKLSLQSNWNSPRGTTSTDGQTNPRFAGARPEQLDFTAYLDDYTWAGQTSTIAEVLNGLLDWCVPTVKGHSGGKGHEASAAKGHAGDSGHSPRPPCLNFTWGNNELLKEDVKWVIKQMSVTMEMFDHAGTLTRATVTLSMTAVGATPSDQNVPTNPSSGGATALRDHLVVDGDSLQSIAHEEYRRPGMWRALADANGIDDPMRVPAGTRLLVPTRADAMERD